MLPCRSRISAESRRMSSESSETPEVRTIRQLVRLMYRYDLTATDLGDGPSRIRLRRRGVEAAATSPMAVAQPAAPPAPVAPTVHLSPASTPVAATQAGAVIESPMVGTFYVSSGPDSPPFVSPGSN